LFYFERKKKRGPLLKKDFWRGKRRKKGEEKFCKIFLPGNPLFESNKFGLPKKGMFKFGGDHP